MKASDDSQKPRILITGGAGFLGSHFCDYLLDKSYAVVCVDDLSTGAEQNIAHLKSNPHFLFNKSDITKPLTSEVTDKEYKYVINFASPASPPQYQRLAIETLMAGSVGTLQMLEIASKNKARFFQASTSEVYGDPDVHPQPESYWGKVNPYGPRSMYDESKRFSEALIFAFRERHQLSTTIARFFNTYGPRMDPNDGRVVSNFIVQALRREPLTVYGEGAQTRSFCYVDDLIKGCAALLESNEEGPVNLGNPTEFTVLELAEIVKKLTGSKSQIEHRPLPKDDPTQRRPNIDLAKAKLNWQPSVDLESGLQKTIEYFKTVLKVN